MYLQYVTKGRNRRVIKKTISIVLVFILLLPLLVSCKEDSSEARLLSFSESQNISELKKLDGKKVSIIGYMSTLSPVSGKFMYLMNLPYQSCPFCIPNTTQLANTMAVYSKSKDGFEFTDRAIIVTGILDFGNYTDEFSYTYNYRIKNATYEILDTSNMSEELRLWQQLASTNAVADAYTMFEYLNFVCRWQTYTAKFAEGEDYLYPSDALRFIETEGAQYNYGFKDGYFDSLKNTVLSVNETAFAELVGIISDASELADYAYSELKAEKYHTVKKYSETFKEDRLQYEMNNQAELNERIDSLYERFSLWIASWEI